MDTVALDLLRKSSAASHLKRIGFKPHHGIIVMLSSLHSSKSSGIGEFLDLVPLIKWLSSCGFDFIQLLPVQDTGMDNSPYNPISTLALNPVYLSLHALEFLKKDAELSRAQKKLQNLTLTKQVKYHVVRDKKLSFLDAYLEKFGDQIEKQEKYKRFLKEHTWVEEYALFKVLTHKMGQPDWQKWPPSLKNLKASKKKVLFKKHAEEIKTQLQIQYLCFEQFKKVKACAQKHHFFLFGDLPFLVSRQSCDAWANSDLFLMDYSVGSPPDKLTPKGQNWQFPAYNWESLENSNFAWWKLRLKVSENFFHMYRLDHVIGFYRTWNIPFGKEGKDGAFTPIDSSIWLERGRAFLKALLSFSKMLPIGEDLVIPQTIIDSMLQLGICGTRILTWQRTGSGGPDFVPFPLYPVASITHLASHDTSTLSQWWKKYPATAKEFSLWKGWQYTPSLGPKKRLELLKDSHRTSSLFHANLLQEYLALFPSLVHQNMNQERINYPGTPSSKNWRYRFIPSVEDMITHRKLTDAFKNIIS